MPKQDQRTISEAAQARWTWLTAEERKAATRAANAARRRKGTDSHIAALIARAGDLTPEQFDRLRALLPDPGDDQQQAS